ncbi:MAG: type I 3-dehydroquinate dehydratase [Terrimicrobiaceae bacterium]
MTRTNLVGTLHEKTGWHRIAGLVGVLDAVEVRVDSLPDPPACEDIAALPLPAIVTVRDPAEGGALQLSWQERSALYLELLPVAAAVDLEIRNLEVFAKVVEAAHALKKPVIASHHDFEGTPTLKFLTKWAVKARAAGADCVKIAATPKTPSDVGLLLRALEELGPPVAIMGMGDLGKISRLALARCGSCLNYSWVGRPQVPGQWAARDFRKVLDQLVP